jgi:RimJ/RimL family protein N-acetyltransferase
MLRLRQPELTDTVRLVELLNNPNMRKTSYNLPYPYHSLDALRWINASRLGADQLIEVFGEGVVGNISLNVEPKHMRASIGYWVGEPYWGRGYATAAAKQVIEFAFENLGLRKVYAVHGPDNPASARVMEKIGMTQEGTLLKHAVLGGLSRDCVYWGIFNPEYEDKS